MPSPAHAVRRFHLAVDASPAPDATSETSDTRIDIPDGLSYVAMPEGATSLEFAAAPPGPADGPVYLVEPLARGRDLLCVVVAPSGHPVRVNGEQLTHIACLRDEDVVQFDASRSGRVVLDTRSVPGAPPDDFVGVACPICTVVFDAKTRIWICPTCRTGLHAEKGDGPEAYRCVEIGTECPVCRTPIHDDEGSEA